MTVKKSFLKIGFIYTIGQLLSKLISFIMLPIYVKELGPVGFGKLSLVDAVMNFLSTFIILSIYSGYIRFYREYSEDKRNRLRNTAINFAIVMSIISIFLVFTLGKIVAPMIFNFGSSYKILILIVLRAIIDQLIVLFMCDYSLNYKAQNMVLINFIMMISNITFIILLVIVNKWGIIGIYSGYIFGSSLILLYLICKQIKLYKFEFDKLMFKDMFKFSFGLIPCNLSATILDLADRYFLAAFKGYTNTGIYSMGYKIGMLIEPIFISPFKSIFTPYKFEIWKEKKSSEKFNYFFRNYHILGCLFILLLSFSSKLLIIILSTKEYLLACNLIPLILFSYFINGENEFFSLGIQLKNKTYITSIIMLIGGGVNIALNIILIPKFGMYGAAVATLISYSVINVINIFISKRMHNIHYNFKLAYKIDILAIAIYILYFIISNFISNIIIDILIGGVLIIIYILILIFIKVISYNEIKILFIDKLKGYIK